MKARYPVVDFNQRLHNGVVLWKGIPHRIHSEGDCIDIADLVTGEPVAKRIAPDHDDLDIASLELGYINTPVGAYYLTRMPLRQFKQAVTPGSVIEYRLTDRGGPDRSGRGRSEWLMTKEFRNKYLKRYPKFDDVREKIGPNRDFCSAALSPEVAITKNAHGVISVWYKLERVGTVQPDSRVVVVPNSDKAWVISMYLSELPWEVQ